MNEETLNALRSALNDAVHCNIGSHTIPKVDYAFEPVIQSNNGMRSYMR